MPIEEFCLPPQWSLRQSEESVAFYENAAGDVLSINYFPMVPDIAADISDAGALRVFYRRAAESNNAAIVEVDPVRVSNVPAVRTILKARLEPTGFVYIGSYTLPFSDCSYVIKVHSVERGITGMRETAVMMMQLKPFEVDELTGKILGWEQDPYDSSYRGQFMRNRADDPQFDVQFPEHPLSKVRHYLNELAADLEVGPNLRTLRPFNYVAPKGSLWSRLWK